MSEQTYPNVVQYQPDDNLEDLRGQLTQRVVLIVAFASSLLMWLTLSYWPFPFRVFGFGGALLGLSLAVRALTPIRSALARHLLVWGLTSGLLAAMGWFTYDWLPFLALPLIFIGAMLASGSGLIIAALVTLLAIWLERLGVRDYPMSELLFMLSLGTVLAWLTVRTLYTALQWTHTTQQRADQLLAQIRERQVELSRTLKSLELANDLQRHTHRELIAARQQAEEARRMKEQFAANISHELRTPLNLILGFSEMMHLSPEVYGDLTWPTTLRRDVYQIYRSSRHLLEMIEDILDLSRFEMTGFSLNREPMRLEGLLRDTAEIAGDLFRHQPSSLVVEISPELPILELDRTRIRQVLLNLLSNAQRFTEAGTVRLEAKQAGDEVVINVIDTGPGIPADKLPYIFDEFYQVDYSFRRHHSGAGLGLAISKHFVQAHGGRIWAESQEGVGTTVTFALPIPNHNLSGLSYPDEPRPESGWPKLRPCIVVQSSDPGVAALLRRHFEDYEVIRGEAMDQLAELVRLRHPRAIICNTLPGEPFCRDKLATLPVHLIECSLPRSTWLVSDLPIAAGLTKPITSPQLLAELRQLGEFQHILIVDDDRGFVQLVERMLQVTGQALQIDRAYNGEDGLRAMRQRRPDVVLLDLMMPDLDGFQVLEQMQCEPELAGIPVVLLTATSYKEDTTTFQESRVTISRPGGLQPGEILRCLRGVIGALEPRYEG
ncbi:MAG: response regulator [Chloroflexi bacterium]|nr:response regulator [Chloroflexota bacterium]